MKQRTCKHAGRGMANAGDNGIMPGRRTQTTRMQHHNVAEKNLPAVIAYVTEDNQARGDTILGDTSNSRVPSPVCARASTHCCFPEPDMPPQGQNTAKLGDYGPLGLGRPMGGLFGVPVQTTQSGGADVKQCINQATWHRARACLF